MNWRTSRRTISIERPLVMGILNLTPDSFSDGGRFADADAAVRRAQEMVAEGADIIDVGGESTRPGSMSIDADGEIGRVVPVLSKIANVISVPLSIDTTKAQVAAAAVDAGAEIINDISGLRWDPAVADVAVSSGAGLVLMHSRGGFETMHTTAPAGDAIADVVSGLEASVSTAMARGVDHERIAVDVGIGFGKAFEQNLELLRNLDNIVAEFLRFPMAIGTSRKSFIGRMLGGVPLEERLPGSLVTAIVAAQKGAKILRVHDVKETVAALRILALTDK